MGHKAGASIEWADYVCNTVKGQCPADPPCEYCYMAGFFQRFKWNPEKRTGLNPELRLDEKELSWKAPPGSLVFCCDSLDLLHPDIEYKWVEETIRMIDLDEMAGGIRRV
jgi:protein gp37